MKFTFLKFNREKLPSLSSLRPPIFNIKMFWYSTFWICLLIFLITFFIGGKIFYSQYFETYKKTDSPENFESLINIKGLKNAIEKRNEFINKELSLPQDPSL